MEPNCQLYNTIHGLLVNNLEFFNRGAQISSSCAKFVNILTAIREHVEFIEQEVQILYSIVHLYDVDEDTLGNGFRSYISLMETFLQKSITLCRTISLNRESVLFRGEKYCKELEACASVFNGFRTGIIYLKKMMASNKEGELFSPNGTLSGQELLDEYGNLDQTGFYGRFLGFYYCESMRKTLLGVSIIMASFSDLYQKSGGALSHAASSLINGSKYSFYPDLRARQIVHVAQNASVEFIKSFWSLSEIYMMKQVPGWLCPKPAINEEIFIPMQELHIHKADGSDLVEIPIPSSHLPKAPVRCRLYSHIHRQGQISSNKTNMSYSELSSSLLFHCHGGGFISQSPEAHEIYLRDWAKDLNVPIFSIDYSLSPGAPFPRALEEVLLAYVWAILNCTRLGWTGERIVVAGDSAGGNLVMGLTLKTIDLGIRIPDSVFCAYTPLILDLVPSPSRLLCVMDPLLPLGFMLSCLDAYAGSNNISDIIDDEFEEEQHKNPTSRRQSVIQALDSGINLLMGLKEFDVEDCAVEAGEYFKDEEEEKDLFDENSPILRGRLGRHYSVALDTTVLKSNNQPIEGHISQAASQTLVPNAGDYADAFIDKYVNTSTFPNIENFDQEEHLIYDLPNDLSFDIRRRCYSSTQGFFSKLASSVKNNLCKKHIAMTPIAANCDSNNVQANGIVKCQSVPWFKESKHVLANKLKKIRIITSNPFMSPILASDEMLQQFPPVYFVVPSYDPTLDDSVMFSRRLKRLGKPFKLDFVDKLPHGFLSFLPFCKEAHEGSKLCVARLWEALGLPSRAT